MSVYKRGDQWWYKFSFNGEYLRESAKTDSKVVARDAERARRRELEQAFNRIPKRERVPLLARAAQVWLAGKAGLDPRSRVRYEQCIPHLLDVLGNRMTCDIDSNDIAEYQRKRLADGVSTRTVNYEVGALRGILRQYGLWGPMADRVKALRERHDVGRAVTSDDESKLLRAAGQSRSPALLPLLVLSMDTGMRASEVQSLRRRDLRLTWENGLITGGEVVVPKSKTPAGTGRLIPLSRRACACLTMWLPQFPDAVPETFVFPRHMIGMAGNKREARVWNVDLNRPMGTWRKAWLLTLKQAGVRYRWHDLRHTWASWHVQQGTPLYALQELGGWESPEMVRRYAHLSAEHLAPYADRLCAMKVVSEPVNGTNLSQVANDDEASSLKSLS